jgi:hypothetical protein
MITKNPYQTLLRLPNESIQQCRVVDVMVCLQLFSLRWFRSPFFRETLFFSDQQLGNTTGIPNDQNIVIHIRHVYGRLSETKDVVVRSK